MRVLISRNAYDWQYGGAEKFSFNMAMTLRQNKIESVVASRVPELLKHCHEQKIPTLKNIWLQNETRRSRLPLYWILFPALVLQYVYVILRYRVDVLLLGSRDDQIFATLAATITGRPVIWVDHADMKGITSQPMRYLRWTYYWTMRHACKIVAVSKAELATIQNNLPEDIHSHFTVINNGAIRQPSQPLERPANKFVVTYVGRIEADKGIYDLASAIPQVIKSAPNTIFWLVGKGAAEKDLKNIIEEANLQENVTLWGHLDNVYDALDSSDLFVYPSHHDASPLAPAEALLAGVPVIGTQVGGIPEIIDESCGRLVPKSSPEKLAAEIIGIAKNPALHKKLVDGALTRANDVKFETIVKERYIPLLEEATR